MDKSQYDLKNKLKWNKSSLLETDLYIKMYLAAINVYFDVEEKQTLFLISKYFTDAAAEVGRNHFALADFYYKKGETYYSSVTKDNLLFQQILNNVYHRSKSFYYYKQKDFETSIQLIEQANANNLLLEKKGFVFLIFDRVQQYYNLARVNFSMGRYDQGFNILADSTCFLMTLKSKCLLQLNENEIREWTPDMVRMRHSLLCQFICDTADQLMKMPDKEAFFTISIKYFGVITKELGKMKVFVKEDSNLKAWLVLLKLFYDKKADQFKKASVIFLAASEPFFGTRPAGIIKNHLDQLR